MRHILRQFLLVVIILQFKSGFTDTAKSKPTNKANNIVLQVTVRDGYTADHFIQRSPHATSLYMHHELVTERWAIYFSMSEEFIESQMQSHDLISMYKGEVIHGRAVPFWVKVSTKSRSEVATVKLPISEVKNIKSVSELNKKLQAKILKLGAIKHADVIKLARQKTAQ